MCSPLCFYVFPFEGTKKAGFCRYSNDNSSAIVLLPRSSLNAAVPLRHELPLRTPQDNGQTSEAALMEAREAMSAMREVHRAEAAESDRRLSLKGEELQRARTALQHLSVKSSDELSVSREALHKAKAQLHQQSEQAVAADLRSREAASLSDGRRMAIHRKLHEANQRNRAAAVQSDTALNLKVIELQVANASIREAGEASDAMQRRSEQTEQYLELSDNLLSRIMPPTVWELLRQNKRCPPSFYSDVTVLFSDIVGFSAISGHAQVRTSDAACPVFLAPARCSRPANTVRGADSSALPADCALPRRWYRAARRD